jgi:hypothetical protein
MNPDLNKLAQLEQTLQGDFDQNASTIATDSAQIAADAVQIAALGAQLAVAQGAGTTPAQLFSGLEANSSWEGTGNAGNSGGSNPSAPGPLLAKMTPATLTGGASFELHAGMPYGNSYWLIRLAKHYAWMAPPAHAKSAKVRYQFEFGFPSVGDVRACQAVEAETQMNPFGTAAYNMAVQIDPMDRRIATFDLIAQQWCDTGIGWDPSWMQANSRISVDLCCVLDFEQQSVTHESITLNGRAYALAVRKPARAQSAGAYFNAAFQLDSTQAAVDFKAWTSNMAVTVSYT